MVHVDARIRNVERVPHVVVAAQALLHSSPLVMFIERDEEHRKTCRVLLRCLFCCLHKMLDEMRRAGIADVSTLVDKWNGISSRMPLECQRSALQVLSVFVDVMRMEFAMRNPDCTGQDVLSTFVAKMWQIEMKREVSCPACGVFCRTTFSNTMNLSSQNVSDLEISIGTSLFATSDEECPQCMQREAKITPQRVCLPQCLIIHIDECMSDFRLPYEINIIGTDFRLNCMIVEPKDKSKNCFIITQCPDARFKRLDDTKVSNVSQITLITAPFLYNSKLTMIYQHKRKKTIPTMVAHDNSTINNKGEENTASMEESSEPNISALSLTDDTQSNDIKIEENRRNEQENISDRNRKRDASTQTDKNTKEAEVQTVPYFCYEVCKHNPKFKFFTGLGVQDFQNLFSLVGGDEAIKELKMNYRLDTPHKIRPTKLTSEDKLFLFLIRLRRGLPLQELSEMFQISVALAGELCFVMTRLIYLTFKAMEDDWFPTVAEQRKYKPQKMKHFKNLRIILDGASFFIQTPSNFAQQGNTYSSYKSHTVIVFSVGIACNGATIFCSEGMEGSMSDKAVILKSGLLERLDKGDVVMTDRGYELTAELQAKGCHLLKPPTLGRRDTFTKEEEILTKAIATARIYSEHAIADMKDNRLLQGVIPFTMLPVLSDLVYIAAYLRNFSSCRIRDKRLVCQSSEQEEPQLASSSAKVEEVPAVEDNWEDEDFLLDL